MTNKRKMSFPNTQQLIALVQWLNQCPTTLRLLTPRFMAPLLSFLGFFLRPILCKGSGCATNLLYLCATPPPIRHIENELNDEAMG